MDVFCGVVDVVDWLDYFDVVCRVFVCCELVRDGYVYIYGVNLGMCVIVYMVVGGFVLLCIGEDVVFIYMFGNIGVIIVWLVWFVVVISVCWVLKVL